MRANDTAIGYLSLTVQIAVFLAMGVVGRNAAELCSWQSIVAARTCLGAVFVIMYSLITRTSLPWSPPKGQWIRSALGAIGIQFTFYALANLPLSTTISVFRSSPVWTALIAWFFLGVRITLFQSVAIVSTIVGVLCICHPSDAGPMDALFCAFIASVFQSVVYVVVHRMRECDPVQIVVHSSSCAAVTSLLVLSLTDDVSTVFSICKDVRLSSMLALVGLLGAVGQILLTISCRKVPPVVLATAGLIEVPLSLMIGAYLRRVSLTASDLAGAFMICAGAGYLVLSNLPPVPDRIGITRRQGQAHAEMSEATLM